MNWINLSRYRYLFFVVLVAFLYSCASINKLHGLVGGEPGSHKVTEVVAIASKEEIESSDNLYQPLVSAGIDPGQIKNGSIISGRIYCCGGSGTVETENNVFVFIPPEIEVELNDILEFVEGHGPNSTGRSQLNLGIKVRNKHGVKSGECKWEPDDPNLWLRVLNCSWMENEGWVKGGTLSPEWLKEPSN